MQTLTGIFVLAENCQDYIFMFMHDMLCTFVPEAKTGELPKHISVYMYLYNVIKLSIECVEVYTVVLKGHSFQKTLI